LVNSYWLPQPILPHCPIMLIIYTTLVWKMCFVTMLLFSCIFL
jgi:hypothetical protein